eukprot:TRINITY_DN102510_c0_g1_i1.p1 TRINITY_DN102510_c0_g1~~TRINITY_DN102510_c0_g1_i1.p1  ORF type:complete len:138 (-),score=28.34 TRINITY_DN102510_c0_g1_i1:6-359(-)
MVIFAFLPASWLASPFLAMSLVGLGQVWVPALTACITSAFPADSQGLLQGALTLSQALLAALLQLILARVFKTTSSSCPGGVWLAAATFNFLAFLLALRSSPAANRRAAAGQLLEIT